MSDTPIHGIPYVPEGVLDPAAGVNDALNVIDALIQARVISFRASPPSSPADGDAYIVTVGTGDWVGYDDRLVRYVSAGAFWQSYVAGSEVNLILNQADSSLYVWALDSNGGSWTVITSSSGSTLTISDLTSNATSVPNVTGIQFSGADVQSLGGGNVRVTINPTQPAAVPIVTVSGTSHSATAANKGNYTRFTNAGAKTYSFSSSAGYAIGAEYHARNVGSGDLTLEGDSAFTLRPPNGGGLKVKQGGTVTIKITASDEADIMGQTST
jgi:hypothetical protein